MGTLGRRTISIIMSVIMVLSCFAGMTFSVGADTSGDYEYEVLDDGTIALVDYVGADAEKIEIPSELDGKKVTQLGSEKMDVLFRCTKLKSVIIPNSVTSIGDSAFSYCDTLTSITIPNSVTSIGYHAFRGCTGLTVISIPNSVTLIDDAAFEGCTGLTGISIPNSVTSIGSSVFEGCTGLTGISIPNSVTSIGDSVFEGCSCLKEINVNKDNKNYKSVDGVLFNKSMTEIISYPEGKEGGYVIPDGVKKIDSYTFRNCIGLTSVTIPDSVTEIESERFKGAFSGCTGLTTITIPNSVTTIGNYTFSGCIGLTSITIPDSVTEIKEGAFQGCTGLTSIKIGNGVTAIEDYAFLDCAGLTSITIPDSVVKIGSNNYSIKSASVVFSGCESLKEINVNEHNKNYKSIDGVVFDKDMTEIVIYPNNKEGGFVIPDGVKELGFYDFFDCAGLTSVTIPASTTRISQSVFSGCPKLKEINVNNDNEKYKSIDGVLFNKDTTEIIIYPKGKEGGYVIPDGVKEIGSAFSGCKVLTSVTIPDGVTKICKYAFSGCRKLTNIIIPDSVSEIEMFAFESCPELYNVTIPASVKEIGQYAFGVRSSDSWNGIPSYEYTEGFTVFGYPGTYAEEYANSHGFKFLDVNIPCEHNSTVIMYAKSATCTKDGYSGDTHCGNCNKLFEKGTEIKALGHKFADGKCTVCGEADPNYTPIEKPTEKPTEVPAEKPTETPTEKPTEAPTEKPTEAPTEKPTKAPTEKTTEAPTEKPTEVPTEKPTEVPTEKPIEKPTEKPTEAPTEKPSETTTEPTTKADEKLEFADNSNIDGKIDEENKKVSIVPSASTGISLDDFKAMFKGAVSVAGEKIEKVFNGMKFTFNSNEYTFILKGDTSPDGKITAKDARTILRIAARLDSPDDVTKEAADVDSDGKATSKEARSVLRFAAKLQNKLYE